MASDVNHSSRDHAEFSPSSLKYVELCPSYKATGGGNEVAKFGTACHEAVELRDWHKAPEGGEELVKKALGFLEHLEQEYPAADWRYEVRVFTHEPECWGTVDVLGYEGATKKIILCDWKFGYNHVDEASQNVQLGTYALGAWTSEFPEAKSCDVWLVNPRRDEVSQHQYSLAALPDLRKRVTTILRNAKEKRGEEFHPGDACQYCAIKDSCPAVKNSFLAPLVREELTLPEVMDPSQMTPGELSRALDVEKVVSDMVSSWSYKLKQEVINRIDAGEEVPGGWEVRSKKGRLSVEDSPGVEDVAKEFGLSREAIEQARTVNVSQLADLLYEEAPNRQKKKTRDSFMTHVTAEGYVKQARITYLKKNKKNEQNLALE